jgi:hypothetical protein
MMRMRGAAQVYRFADGEQKSEEVELYQLLLRL